MIMKLIKFTLSVTWKEIQVISKERAWLVILFLLPLMIGAFFGGGNLAMNRPEGDVILLKVSLVNLDSGIFGVEMAKVIKSIEQFEATEYPDVASAEQPVANGKANAAIIIPADFSQKIDSYTPTQVQVIVDPAEVESGNIVAGIMNQVIAEFALWGEVQHGVRTILGEAGILAAASPEQATAIEAQNLGVVMTRINEMRTNPVIAVSVESAQGVEAGPTLQVFFAYLFPGLTVMFIYFIVAMSGSSLLAEREAGTLRRLLTAPIPRGAILAGKMLAFMMLACAQVVVMFAVAALIFGTPLGRSPTGLIVLTLVVAFNATALGMLVASISKTSKQADSLGVILAFVLAGIGGALAIGQTPFYRQGGMVGFISSLTPQNHAVEGFYQLMGENASFVQVLPQIGILLGMGLLFFLIALWKFRFDK
jgi:ABC-2 type transport system permease protein